MKALLQRVRRAHVEVAGETVGAIDTGLLVLICAERGDTEAVGQRLLDKILKLRVFYDAFVTQARVQYPVVATGVFGADMQVHLVNDGPVTIPMQITPSPQ